MILGIIRPLVPPRINYHDNLPAHSSCICIQRHLDSPPSCLDDILQFWCLTHMFFAGSTDSFSMTHLDLRLPLQHAASGNRWEHICVVLSYQRVHSHAHYCWVYWDTAGIDRPACWGVQFFFSRGVFCLSQLQMNHIHQITRCGIGHVGFW